MKLREILKKHPGLDSEAVHVDVTVYEGGCFIRRRWPFPESKAQPLTHAEAETKFKKELAAKETSDNG